MSAIYPEAVAVNIAEKFSRVNRAFAFGIFEVSDDRKIYVRTDHSLLCNVLATQATGYELANWIVSDFYHRMICVLMSQRFSRPVRTGCSGDNLAN